MSTMRRGFVLFLLVEIVFSFRIPKSPLLIVDIFATGNSYYVAPNGNDLGSCTSIYSPCKTISQAGSKLSAGDTLYIRGGVYHEGFTITRSGTSTRPITITNYKDEEPILDGSVGSEKYKLPARQGGGALGTLKGNYIIVENLTARYSGDRGFNILGEHDIVSNTYVYENWGSGIFLNSNYNTAEGNRARSNSMKYYYYSYPDSMFPGSTGWSTGITCARYPTHCTIRNNTTWDNWGHGISTYEAIYTTIEGNTTYNNMKLNLYVSDAKNTITRNNLSYCTPRNDRNKLASNFQFGLYIGDELGFPQPFPGGSTRVPSSDNIFVNNLVMGCDKNLSTKAGISNGDLFAYNTLINADSGGKANFELRGGSCTNCRFINNLILQENSTPIAVTAGSGMMFSHNLWSKSPGSIESSTDVIGTPQISKCGSFTPGQLTPSYFKLGSTSPAINKAMVLSEVTEDFFHTQRGSTPDIGAYESDQSSTGGRGKVGGVNSGDYMDIVNIGTFINIYGLNLPCIP